MELSHAQKMQVYKDGYTVLRGAVPRMMIDQALREINQSLGEGLPKEDITKFRAQTYCRELTKTPTITNMINRTPVFDACESLLGKGKVRPTDYGQIALRFPSLNMGPVKAGGGHIDGIYTPDNGVPAGEIHNFTMLAVVLLSDLPEENCGNFTVYPGTHHALEAHFRQHGPECVLKGMPKIDQPPAVQTTGKAGDVVLTHYQLIHTVGPHVGPNIRYAAIYRINHADRTSYGSREAMLDIWKEWPGVREIIPERSVPTGVVR